MINKKTLAYNLFFLFLGQGAGGVLLFITMAYLARTLGPERFGIIGFAEVVFMFFLALSSFGINFIGAREIARGKDNISYYVDRILPLRFILGLAAFLLLVIVVLILPKPAETKYTTIVYGLALIPASLMLDWLFQGVEKMHYVSIGVFAKAALFMLGAFWLINEGSDTAWVGYIFLISWMISSVLVLFFYTVHYGMPWLKWDFTAQKKLLIDSWPIGLGLVVGWVVHYFDTTILFLLKGEGEAGQYNAAYRPIILIATALTVYFSAVFPAMSRAAIDNISSMKKIVNVTLGGGLAIMLPIVVLGSYFCRLVIETAYGQRFSSGGIMFALLLWWPLLVLIVLTYARVLVCYDKQNYTGRIAVITALLNIGMNLLFIPFWGGIGAALAKIGTELITLFIYQRVIKEVLNVPLLKLVQCPLIAVGAMVVFLNVAVSFNAWFLAAGAMGVYLATLFISSKFVPNWVNLVTGRYVV